MLRILRFGTLPRMIVWLAVFGLSWNLLGTDPDEKEIRALHHTAEAAMHRSDFTAARDAYQEIVTRIIPPFSTSSKAHLDWQSYVDLLLRLAQVHLALEEHEAGEEVLGMLLATHPPAEFTPQILLLKARFQCGQEGGTEAYLGMKELARTFPMEGWRPEDRTLFHALEYSLNMTYDTLYEKAKRFFKAGAYGEAIALFEELDLVIAKGGYPKAGRQDSLLGKRVRCRLAEAHFLQEEYKEAAAYAVGAEEDNPYDRQLLYLAALACKEQREYASALAHFDRYLSSAAEADLEHYESALFERAHAELRLGREGAAKEQFETLANRDGRVGNLSTLYLARLYLKEREFEQSERSLKSLAARLPEKDPFQNELAFLLGRVSFERGAFHESATWFERALPKEGALLHLGLSFLEARENLDRAAQIFERLKDEQAALGLAKLHLVRGEKGQVAQVLNRPFSLEGKGQALLLQAEAATSRSAREALLREATHERFASTPAFGASWYARGCFHFQEGDVAAAKEALERAFLLYSPHNQKGMAEVVKMEAKVELASSEPEKALTTLDRLEPTPETLYLRGLVAAQLGKLELARTSFEEAGLPESVEALATLHFQRGEFALAEKAYVHLATTFPDSPCAPEALLWAAEAAERVGREPSVHRKAVYTLYPKSAEAPEAFFRLFPEEAYVEGKAEALAHLATFPFPNSSLQLAAHYYRAIHEPNPKRAKELLTEGLYHFAVGSAEPHLLYIHACAEKVLAELLMGEEDNERALALLGDLVLRLRSPSFRLTQHLMRESPYPPLLEECEYALALCYEKVGMRLQAQEILAHMLKRFGETEITEGRTLALTWLEQGKIALTCRDFETAALSLELAEMCGEGWLESEERLLIWMLQSDCHRECREYDAAMKKLSQVINEEVSSPLRLKAMYQRAEIYELQGRHELAIRQLEATVKKGGEWAEKAKEQLRKLYGMDA